MNDRRAFLKAGTAAALVAPLPALAAETVDPHIAWGQELEAVNAKYRNMVGIDDDDVEDWLDQTEALCNAIASTAPTTIAGLVVILRIIVDDEALPEDGIEEAKVTALRFAERLAEARS